MSINTKGEIVTLQFGHYSNFVGTHWWNIQENSFEYSDIGETNDVKHDVLYREGVNDKGQITFTPRVLLVDLKGSLGALPEKSQLYEDITDPSEIEVEWQSDRVEVKADQKIQKNKYQQDLENEEDSNNETDHELESQVKVWSDFLYARFHPRTVNIVKEYQHEDGANFNTFSAGMELWNSGQFEEEFSDKIRNYVEECDYFQGFQILLDAVDGFSGLATSCIEYLDDEYKRTTVAFPMIPSFYSDYKFETEEERHLSLIKDSMRVLNVAFCFNALRESSSLFVPLCTGKNGWRQPGDKREFYHSKYNPELYYHSAAILASALDTFSLKYRLKCGQYTLQDLSSDLTPNSRTAAAASVCLPFSLNSDSELIDCLDNWTGSLTQSITPKYTVGSERMVQLYVLRGIPENRLKKPVSKAGLQKELAAYKCNTIHEMLELYLSCTTFASINNVTVVNNGLPVKTPYPKIFDNFVGYNGNIISSSRPSSIDVQSVPVMAALHNGSGVGDMLDTLHTETNKIKFRKFHQFNNTGMDVDDFVECLDRLFDFRECYDDSYYL